MGIVSDHLRDLIAAQVNGEKRLVVWFDPDRDYADFAATLALPATAVARYDGSFFALRAQVNRHLDADEPPRLVVYVPLAEEATHDALVELTAPGVVLKPGQQPWQRNTRLSVIAKNALKDVLPADHLRSVERQVENRQLSLAELDDLAARTDSPAVTGTLHVIFGTGNVEEIALALLSSGDRFDAAIAEKRAQDELAALLATAYGVDLPAGESLHDLRTRLARHILTTDLLLSLQPPLPQQFTTIKVPAESATRDACTQLARRWRQSRDLAASYVMYANQVEQELGLAGIPFTLQQMGVCETFAAIDRAAETAIGDAICTSPSSELQDVIERRRASFWAEHSPERRIRWSCYVSACKLLLQADEIESALAQKLQAALMASDLFARYTAGKHPWCELDTYQRELEQQAHRLDTLGAVERVLTCARQRYMDIGDQLAQRFTHALAEAGFQIAGARRQTDAYARTVAPALREGKTAYILVDALRFEMARALVEQLTGDYVIDLQPALAAAPTITEIGMAALLPGAQDGARVVAGDARKLALQIGDTALRDRNSRVAWLKARAGLAASDKPASVLEMKLEDLLSPSSQVKADVGAADLVFVTSQEIDEIAEMDNLSLARALMDDLLGRVARAIRRLADLGCQHIIVAADHGYLFGDELGSEMKLDSPGGETLDLHRRVWVGRGGAASDTYLRVKLTALGLGESGSDLELATPWGFGIFKVQGGARAYFHGGLSLPELVVPVATLTPAHPAEASSATSIRWTLALGSKKISTRFCTVQIGGQRGLFEAEVPPVRLEIRAGKETISTIVSATYGYNEVTREVQLAFDEDNAGELKPNSVALMITRDDLPPQPVTVHLLDALTGRELSRLDAVEMTIAI